MPLAQGAFQVDITVLPKRSCRLSRLGQECQPFSWGAPIQGLFDANKVVIVSNGRYGVLVSMFANADISSKMRELVCPLQCKFREC